ncbi:MAG: 5-(carboxyamino)imidazole ribonucleotide synthase [Nitrospira sp.]|nr:5-(carboxyamino)imidazole ribonucleotide synthase [Nitrospira sp.]HMW86963.1 5-(carboxyamino)imidazole ribonucleotide synthase [Nitrospira sp.]HMZ97517.1 5-(carboxyamino)imidazole ribonucleotide synthase [Nitrospira sp.]HNA47430.1 5-(carboxyamino)imidazole ribonucleotide synthase [Nitrospira sp.]HNG03774.1 5-(carboxyamino)imidazole ribonucleotide synthase [Nitrospira sp.]
MNVTVIDPGATLGVLGGGQLGAMFATAARRMGYAVNVWDPDPEAPAHRIADHSLIRPFTDADARKEFTQRVRAVTYEWENVPADLCEQLECELPVRPSSRVLRVIQDRIEQKTFLRSRGLPVPVFATLASPEELGRQTMPAYPLVCKTATAGYDGKGQWKILRAEDCPAVQQELARTRRPGSRWILEEWLPFQRELSILVVRGADGASQTYPLVDNVHEEGILRQTIVPADVPQPVADLAGTIACDAVQALDGVGVFCVELFLMADGRLVINEIAPRPHNSGHYTLDACTVSQFEQQVRTLCGLPLGEIRLLSPAVMLNLIGEDVRLVTHSPAAQDLLRVPGAIVHLYGKRTIRPKRKMGHISFLAPTRAEALTAASTFRSRFAPIHS